MKRTALWTQKMRALGCDQRIQSLVVYDCNSTNVRKWNEAAVASGYGHISITPTYLPFSEGFLRQPNFFMSHYGAIERDIERIVDDMERRANEAGSRPQLILEWFGFGGHARLSYLVHEHVADRFPGSKFLPIFCMPSERVLEQNIRDHYLWHEAEDIIGPVSSLITDNRASGSIQTLDERIALGIATMESCYRFRPDVGTMPEIVSMFNLAECRWLSLDATDMPYRVDNSRSGRRNDSKERAMAQAAVVQGIKEAIWRIAEPDNHEHHTGFFTTKDTTQEQRICCLLPFTPEVVEEIKEDVEDQLQRETFSAPFPGTKVAFASGNALWRQHQNFAYGHIFKLSGLPAEPVPPSIQRVLYEDSHFRTSRRRVKSRGEERMDELGMDLPTQEEAARPAQMRDNVRMRAPATVLSRQQHDAEPETSPNGQFDQSRLEHGEGPLIDPEAINMEVN